MFWNIWGSCSMCCGGMPGSPLWDQESVSCCWFIVVLSLEPALEKGNCLAQSSSLSPGALCIQILVELRLGKPGSLLLTWDNSEGHPNPRASYGIGQSLFTAAPQFTSCPFLLSPLSCRCCFQECSPIFSASKSLSQSLFPGNLIWGMSLGAMMKNKW